MIEIRNLYEFKHIIFLPEKIQEYNDIVEILHQIGRWSCNLQFFFFRWVFLHSRCGFPDFVNQQYVSAGVIQLPYLGGIKQGKCRVILRDFPYDSAWFGFGVIEWPPVQFGCISHAVFFAQKSPWRAFSSENLRNLIDLGGRAFAQ